MKAIVQNKINSIKALSASIQTGSNTVKINVDGLKDNLSRSIRNKREAAIFQNELKIAIKMAKG